MNKSTELVQEQSPDLISITLSEDWVFAINISPSPLLLIISFIVVCIVIAKFFMQSRLSDFEIDCAEIGIGDQKVSLKPNDTDRQIAYSIWVELSTRKIGLPIDLDHDVIDEVYNSWYEFFGITRALIKDIPVSKARQKSTSKITEISIEVLNDGLRPHLTKWQARFRKWHDNNARENSSKSPQMLQQEFPEFEELSADLLDVNKKLIAYKNSMKALFYC